MKEDDLELSVFSETKEKKFDTTDIIKLKKQFKDTVFSYIFSNPEKFSELYEAISGRYINANELEETRVDSLVISDWYNDVSFMTKDRQIVIFFEEQSSLCKNMSIRCLVYYANLIRKFYDENKDGFKKKLYGSTELKIPKPEFYILYIGTNKLTKEIEYLSDHFIEKDNSGIELKVRSIDIHYSELLKENMQKSSTLLGYSYLIQQYHIHMKELKSLQKQEKEKRALQMAINDCRERGYLLEFLDRKEFMLMAQDEFTIRDFIELKEEEARKEKLEERIEGKIEGKIETQRNIVKNMYQNGMDIEKIVLYTGVPEEEVRRILL